MFPAPLMVFNFLQTCLSMQTSIELYQILNIIQALIRLKSSIEQDLNDWQYY